MCLLYSSTSCAPCVSLKRLLAHLNVDYEERPTEQTEYADEAFKLVGMRVVPVLVVDGQVVAGYNPKRIFELFKRS